VGETIHKRLIEIALEDLGPAPRKFAFMVLGSQARGEQTLATDQDNALVIDDSPGKLNEKDRAYFLELGNKINQDLNTVGYKFCPGEIMAGNPKWNQDLKTWQSYFSKWIQNSHPQDVLNVAIFFDFRSIYGEDSLIDKLRSHVNLTVESKTLFFHHVAQSIVKIKVSANLPGNLKAKSQSDTQLDIKLAMIPITSYIRLYAIREKLASTNSLERAGKLHKRSVIDASTLEELTEAFNFLTHLRIKTQAYSIARNEAPGNSISLGQLSQLDALTLKKIFTDISATQTRLGSGFSGMV